MLALFGGQKTITKPFKRYRSIGREELSAARRVIESGVLSDFVADSSDRFYGGVEVQRFEKECKKYFSVEHAISVNSWTSGLIAAVGALDIEPGDEVIVPPWTMSATATAVIHWNAIPVFADIEEKTFCISPESVKSQITDNTKGIVAVDIFGQSVAMDELSKIARQNNIKIISDSAQAPGAKYRKKFAGTIGDIGGFSLNYHKHIHTGEGGIVVTNDDHLADRIRLIRNHAEAIVDGMGIKNLSNMIGYNFRMGELEAAIGYEQLRKLDRFAYERQQIAECLTVGLGSLEGITTPVIRDECTHVFYVYPLILDVDKLGIPRRKIVEALLAEGVQGLVEGYTNLHLLPMYQKKIAYGSAGGFPWSAGHRNVSYEKGICPVAEKLHDNESMNILLCNFQFGDEEIELTVEAFQKVWSNLEKL